METVVVSSSRSVHGNTQRIATAIGGELGARMLTPEQATPDALAGADRIGFGSGIYFMSFDRALLDCVARLPDMSGKQAFVFATSGLPETPLRRYTRRFAAVLHDRGFEVVGSFLCRGLDTWGPYGLIGGVSRNHPDPDDLARARSFAAHLGGGD